MPPTTTCCSSPNSATSVCSSLTLLFVPGSENAATGIPVAVSHTTRLPRLLSVASLRVSTEKQAFFISIGRKAVSSASLLLPASCRHSSRSQSLVRQLHSVPSAASEIMEAPVLGKASAITPAWCAANSRTGCRGRGSQTSASRSQTLTAPFASPPTRVDISGLNANSTIALLPLALNQANPEGFFWVGG